MQGVARRRRCPQCKVPCEFLQSTGRDFAINEYQKIISQSDDLDPLQQSTCTNWKKKSWCGQGRSPTCSVTGVPGPPLLIFGTTIWPILDYNSMQFILVVFIFSPIDKHHFLHFRHHPTRSCLISQKCMVKPRARSYTKLELNEIPREESNSWKLDHFIVSASQFFCSSALAILPNRCLASGLTIRMRKFGLPATQPGVVGVPSTPPIAKLDQLDLAACTYCKNLWCDSRCCTLKCQTFWWLL